MRSPFFAKTRVVLLTAFLLGVLQFVWIPSIGGTNRGAKQFVFVFCVLCAALLVVTLVREVFIPRVAPFFLIPIAGFFGSALQARHPYDAMVGVGVLACCLLFLILIANLSKVAPDFFERLIDALVFFGVFASMLGCYQYLSLFFQGQSQAMLIPYLLPPAIGWGPRVSGVFDQPNLFALLLVLCLLALVYRGLHSRVRPSMLCFGLLWLAVFWVALVFFFTHSRAGLLSLLAVFGLLSFLFTTRRYVFGRPGMRRTLVLLLLALACSFATYRFLAHADPCSILSMGMDAPAAHSAASAGVQSLEVSEVARSGSNDQRLVFWMTALLVFLEHPWFGVGLDNYKYFLAPFQVQAHDLLKVVEYEALGYASHAHNEYLQLLCEGGLPVLLCLPMFAWLFLRSFRRSLSTKAGGGAVPLFYCHLFLLPFLIQSLVSYPLRYPSLLVLFLAFAGISLSHGQGRMVTISAGGRWSFAVVLVFALLLTGQLFRQDAEVGKLRSSLAKSDKAEEGLLQLSELASNPYSEYIVLQKAATRLGWYAVRTKDKRLAARLVPLAERLVQLEGAYWEWYLLARLYHVVGREEDSYLALNVAIERNPVYEPPWQYRHHLDILRASSATGRAVESFYPTTPLSPEIASVRDIPSPDQQNL